MKAKFYNLKWLCAIASFLETQPILFKFSKIYTQYVVSKIYVTIYIMVLLFHLAFIIFFFFGLFFTVLW